MKIHSAFFVQKSFYEKKIDITEILLSSLDPQITKETEINSGMSFKFDPSILDQSILPKKIFKSKRQSEILQIDLLLCFEIDGIISKEIRYRQPNIEKGKKSLIKIEIPNFEWNYTTKSTEQLKTWYDDTEKKGMSEFIDFADFESWYQETVSDKSCKYCGLKERDSQKLVHNGILTSLRFPIYKITSQGVNRGYWLEIDKKDPKGLYSRENCNPACYFCNNDKSDVFSDTEYKEIRENGWKGYISKLISNIKKNGEEDNTN